MTNAQRRGLSQRSALGMIDGDCSSNSRSRSICILRLAGSSRSSVSDARNLSPISWTIARLCPWSISMGFRMTKPFIPVKASLNPNTNIDGVPSLPSAATRMRGAPLRQRPRPPPLAIFRERLFLNSGSYGEDLWLSATCAVVTASDGLTLQSRGGDFRSRSLANTADMFLRNRGTACRSLTWFRSKAALRHPKPDGLGSPPYWAPLLRRERLRNDTWPSGRTNPYCSP
jgi:hypothetical protein